MIKHCLNCTGFNLPVNIACGLNPDNQTANRLFENSYVEKESLRSYKDGVYEYDDAKKLLEDILRPFSCRLYQSGDEWYIERIKDRIPADTKWIRYASGNIGIPVSTDAAITLDTPRCPFVDSPANLQIDAGYGKQTVKADGDTWDTVIANNFADGITYQEIVAYPSYPFGADHRVWYRRGTGISTTLYKSKYIEQGLLMRHTQNTSEFDRVWQRAQITANNEDEITISFKLTIEKGVRNAHKGHYGVYIQSYIRQRGGTSLLTLKWNDETGNDAIYINGIGTDFICGKTIVESQDWKDGFSKPIDISITAKLEHLHDSFDFDELSFAILPVKADTGEGWHSAPEFVRSTIIGDIEVKVNEQKKYDNTFTAIINRKYLRDAEDLDIRFWTLPSKYTDRMAVNYNYKNGLMNANYTAIRTVGCPAEDSYSTSLPERLLIDNFDQYYDPRDLLSGSVQSDVCLTPDCHYTVAGRLDHTLPDLPHKSFLLTGLEATLKDAIYEVNLEEIKSHQIIANIK